MNFSKLPHLRVRVLFKERLDGQVRWRALYPPMFGAFIKVDDSVYECRIYFEDDGIVYPGTARTFKVFFLRSEEVIPRFSVGDGFQLNTLEILGDGTVLEVMSGTETS